MEKINIQFTLFSAFYSPLISTFSAGFLQEEGLDPDWSVSSPGVSACVCGIAVSSVYEPSLSRGLGFHVSTNIITPTCPNSPAAINVAAQGKPALLVNAEPINGPII